MTRHISWNNIHNIVHAMAIQHFEAFGTTYKTDYEGLISHIMGLSALRLIKGPG